MTDRAAVRIVSRLSAVAVGGFLLGQALRPPPRRRDPPASAGAAAAPAGGRTAVSPWSIPASGWWSVLKRTYREFSDDRVMMVSAGVTYYALLAIFPALAALVSLYGLALDPQTLAAHVDRLAGVLPQGGLDIVAAQLERLSAQRNAALGIGFLVGLAVALWSANAGIKAMFDALNIVYDETEKRGFVRLNLVSLLFTLGAILMLLLAVGLLTVLPAVLGYVGLESSTETLVALARWPLLFVITALAISVLYRFGPSRAQAKWRWITPGSLLATVLWVAVSVLFSWYAANFASYNETYGTLGAVIAFMVWIWLSTAVILLGAELNAEAERQTARDSTTGTPRPMGRRGAVVADETAASS